MTRFTARMFLTLFLVLAVPSAQVGAAFFVRGDTDSNGSHELTDAVRIFGYLFLGNTDLSCLDAADADNSGLLDGIATGNVLSSTRGGKKRLDRPVELVARHSKVEVESERERGKACEQAEAPNALCILVLQPDEAEQVKTASCEDHSAKDQEGLAGKPAQLPPLVGLGEKDQGRRQQDEAEEHLERVHPTQLVRFFLQLILLPDAKELSPRQVCRFYSIH